MDRCIFPQVVLVEDPSIANKESRLADRRRYPGVGPNGHAKGDRGTVWVMVTTARASADVGLIGLAVMGQNLALNMADHGYRVAVYNRTTAVMEKFVAGHGNTPGGLVGAAALPDFVAALKTPRKILLLVKAGAPVVGACFLADVAVFVLGEEALLFVENKLIRPLDKNI